MSNEELSLQGSGHYFQGLWKKQVLSRGVSASHRPNREVRPHQGPDGGTRQPDLGLRKGTESCVQSFSAKPIYMCGPCHLCVWNLLCARLCSSFLCFTFTLLLGEVPLKFHLALPNLREKESCLHVGQENQSEARCSWRLSRR